MAICFEIYKIKETDEAVYYECSRSPDRIFYASLEKRPGRIKFFSTKNCGSSLLVHELSTEQVPLNCPNDLNLYDVRFVAFQLYKAWKAQEFPDSLSKFS